MRARRIHTSATADLGSAVVHLEGGYDRTPEGVAQLTTNLGSLLRGGMRAVRFTGSAGMNMVAVACGRADGYVERGPKMRDEAPAAGTMCTTHGHGRPADRSDPLQVAPGGHVRVGRGQTSMTDRTDRQTNRRPDRQRDGQTEGQRDRGTEGQRDRGTEGQKDRGTEGQRDRGTHGQTDRRADRRTER